MKDKINKLKDFLVKNKKISIAVAVALVVVIVGVIILLVSCGGDSDNGNGDEATTSNSGVNSSDKVTCTVEVKTEGGIPFEKMEVFIYEDSTLDNLVAATKTDENGKMTFEGKGDLTKYVVVLKNVQEGYKTKDYFEITGENTEVVLETEILPLEDMDNTKFELGSVIKDFTVTTPDGTVLKISELLAEKDAVVLNFFYLACEPCKSEFPYMQEAYAQYSDDIAVVALTPVDKDDASIATFAKELGITFYMAQCDSKWEKMMSISSYPTTVVIDRYGVISLRHLGTITNAETFNGIFEYYTGDYKQILTKDVEDIISYEAEEGTKDKPVGILPDATGFEATLAAGEEKYFEIPKVSNLIMEIKDADAYVIYDENKYEAVDGVVKVIVSAPDPYTPAVFVLGNKGTQEKTFNAVFSAVQGTMVNPFTMPLGDFTVATEVGNDQGVYYTYTATENGTLTLKCIKSTEGVNYDFTLYNLNTYVNRNLSVDGGDATVSIEVNAGDVVRFSVGTLPDENNEYPAGEFEFKATHIAGEGTTTGNNDGDVTYTVKVTDSNGKAMKGVTVNIDSQEISTDSKGVATVKLRAGSYIVGVVAPEGYKVQGEPTVSKENPSVTVVLVSTTSKQITYTVKVTDESGNAISGATVVVGSSVSTTNTSGVATFTLAEGKYDVTASANGYTAGSASVSSSATSTTIKLKKNANVSDAVSYTVNVVDNKSEALGNVTVIFKSNGAAVTTAVTDSAGKATVKLASGNYDVALVYDGYGFDDYNAKVTASQTSLTLTMAAKSTTVEDVYFDITGAYKITTGAKYVEVPSEDTTKNEGKNAYFLFEPRKAGTYKISVANPSALLSYWGGSTSYINNATHDVIHTNNSITLNVVEAGPTFVIGIQGVSGCIVTVTRTGDAVTEMAWTDYVATDSVKPYTFSGGTLTYVDITKTGDNPYNLVYNATDGYYHVGSADGPVMLVHLGAGAPYIALSDVIGFTGSGGSNFGKYVYDSNGTLIKKENYTNLLWTYMQNMDETKYVYPLTKDLEYILKNGGEFRGWWASSGYGNSIYAAMPNLNSKIAWMWACCYVAE